MPRIGTAMAFVMGMVASGCLAAPDKAQSLRAEVVAAVHTAVPDATVTLVDTLTIKVKPAAGAEMQIHLDRIQHYCAVNGVEDCAAEKQRFLGGIAEALTADMSIKPAQLRLLVRSSDYAADYAKVLAKGDPPIVRPFAEGISVVLGADYPNTTKIPAHSQFMKLGISEADGIALATRQVLATLPKVPKLEEVEGKLLAVAGVDYGASMMLEPERWQSLALATGGRLFVAIPSDDDVLIGTVAPGEDLRKLQKLIADSYATASRGISPLVYRWSPTGWVVAR